jgi:hypothetical protein
MLDRSIHILGPWTTRLCTVRAHAHARKRTHARTRTRTHALLDAWISGMDALLTIPMMIFQTSILSIVGDDVDDDWISPTSMTATMFSIDNDDARPYGRIVLKGCFFSRVLSVAVTGRQSAYAFCSPHAPKHNPAGFAKGCAHARTHAHTHSCTHSARARTHGCARTHQHTHTQTNWMDHTA